jgi:probable aminopeptidase NPEPL1
MAVARAHPEYSGTSRRIERRVTILLLDPKGNGVDPSRHAVAAHAVRQAQALVDRPPNNLRVTEFVSEARATAKRCKNAHVSVIRGRQLDEQGLGGLWSVGKASDDPPALVVLDHAPEGATRTVVWVGKGIVYDTGGLSIKSKTGMPSMKTDMAGAAAVLAAFEAAVLLGCKDRLTAILCIAENAVGPGATRPDDVITMYSGRTVEVNNTDAEGRLVLADGVAWAVKHRKPDVLLDMATLTGAQAMATGKLHAALYCNDEALETAAVTAGKRSADLAHALPYVPEFFRKEFISQIADMKNSVKDRSNAQSSCAGQFVANHLGDYAKPWIHIDMAAPAKAGGRGTGWGVGLLLCLFEIA